MILHKIFFFRIVVLNPGRHRSTRSPTWARGAQYYGDLGNSFHIPINQMSHQGLRTN